MKRSCRRIVVIRFSSLGDILLTTPALRALKRWNPGGELHFVLKSEYSDLLRYNTNVDEIIPLTPSTGTIGFLKFVLNLRGKYDLLVDFHRSPRSFAVRGLIGAGLLKLKYPKGVISRFIMVHTGWKEIAMKEPIPERYLKALEPLGIAPDDHGIDFPIPDTTREQVRASMREKTSSLDIPEEWIERQGFDEKHYSYLALAPGARWATKRWLPERFAQAADILAERYHLVPALLGHRNEKDISRTVREKMKYPAVDFTGRLDLLETGAVIETSQLLICNDSGVMHMAAALSTPIVAIFGPTTRELGFYPYRARFEVVHSDITCRPCHHLGGDRCPKGHHQCMTDIHVEDVVGAAAKCLIPEPDSVPASKSGGGNEVSR